MNILDNLKNIGKEITFVGRVEEVRDHGKLSFLDVCSDGFLIQVVYKGDISEVQKGCLVEIVGVVKERPEKLVNKNLESGSVEISANGIKNVSETKALPFDLKDTKDIDELTRMRYRYLDLRSSRMKKNLQKRHKFNMFTRNYFSDNGFIEVETPMLTKGTPEGAREYLVPSRLHKDKFYALPQSPQQYKQLLMIADIPKYFQITKCMRDEDLRSDRQPEFTQLDIEMSHVSKEDVLTFIEEYVVKMVGEVFPDVQLKTPFTRLSYEESMEKFKSDKPDLREDKSDENEMAFCWVLDFPLFEKNEEGKIVSTHHPFTKPSEEDLKALEKNPLSAKSLSYDLVLNGFEVGGGSIRISDKSLQSKVFDVLNVTEEEKENKFGHMLEALSFGAPPHGGFAFGVDRLLSILLKQSSIREVIAFPKTREGVDPMTKAPSETSKEQVKELGLKKKGLLSWLGF